MSRRAVFLRCSLGAAVFGGALAAIAAAPIESDKPSISVKASPSVGFSPARVVFTAEVKGGPNDYQEFYCAAIEWDITTVGESEHGGFDQGRHEQQSDCDPYEPGKSEIRRRYTREQVFRSAGEYRVQFRLKQKDKVVGSGRTTVRIRPGLGDPGGWNDR
ncbi:MAG TPA: hypothetical protein VFG08_09745 [Candidatus Polarisedimenticolia bacterium]|nr:hypothetical protein [Candidatus Polarisedimenticolia bacterium]